jgi:PAS domain S-box-containing protein
MSIRATLSILVALSVLPAFLLISLSTIEHKNADINRIKQDMVRLTQNLAIYQENLTASTRQFLNTLEEIPEVKTRNAKRCEQIFAALLKDNPQYVNILAADPSGRIFANALHRPSVSIADRGYFKEVLATRSFAIGEYSISRLTNKPVISFAAPVFDTAGNLTAVVIVGYDPSYYDRIFNASRLEDATLVLADHHGIVIHRSVAPEKFRGQPDILLPQMRDKDHGTFTATGLDGTTRFYSFVALRLSPERSPYLYLRIGANPQRAFAPVLRKTFRDLLIVFSAAASALFLAHILGKRLIVTPLTTLNASANQISAGNLAAVPPLQNGAREILNLSEAFSAMSTALARRHEENQHLFTAIRHSEEQYRIVADFTVNWEYWLGIDDEIVYMSPSSKEITGYAREEFICNPGLLLQIVHPDDLQLMTDHRRQYRRNPSQAEDSLDLRIITRSGEIKWMNHLCRPVFAENGTYLGRRAGNRDITARKEAEQMLKQLNRELEERVQERTRQYQIINRELESFCYSVSHDLRAPVRHINSFSAMVLEELGTGIPDEARHHLERIVAAARSMGELIDGLLNLSRLSRSEMHRVPVDLSRIVSECVATLQSANPDRVVTCDIAPDVLVEGDPVLLRAVIENLVGNAWKFTAKTADARISFGQETQNQRPVFFIRDNGVGFDMTYADKLFQPFQRLHAVTEFEGSGIGLATVQRIIHRHSGEIWAESAPGKGTTFSFTLS